MEEFSTAERRWPNHKGILKSWNDKHPQPLPPVCLGSNKAAQINRRLPWSRLCPADPRQVQPSRRLPSRIVHVLLPSQDASLFGQSSAKVCQYKSHNMYMNYASQSILRFKSINFAGRSWSTQSISASPLTLTTMHGSTCPGIRKIMFQSESNMCQQESKESKTNIFIISYIL